MAPPVRSTPPVLYIALACSLLLNAWLLLSGPTGDVDVASIEELDEGLAEDAAPLDAEPATDTAAVGSGPGDAARNSARNSDGSAGDWTVLRGQVDHSLARTFQTEAGEAGDALASVYTRLFVWDLDMRRDLQKGDSVAVAWRTASDGLPEIAAASLKASKLGKAVTAFRWQAPGDAFPSYWHPDGTEAPHRLIDGPIEKYEQITSLLKDRPSHKGMDFKTPVGTEVTTPRAGKVTRVNWNWTYNGNCVEVLYDDGVLAKFLHLSENKVSEGQRVGAGQVIALSGNTGHSTAPHLHYQLDRGDKTIDPLEYHGTVRRSLDADQVAALKRDIAAIEGMLGESAGG